MSNTPQGMRDCAFVMRMEGMYLGAQNYLEWGAAEIARLTAAVEQKESERLELAREVDRLKKTIHAEWEVARERDKRIEELERAIDMCSGSCENTLEWLRRKAGGR